ncbi:MAG: hypothetical protein WCR30_01555 [Clostridia bacterium]
MQKYDDDAICLCPELVEKMSKEYFSALQNRGFKIVSLSHKNSQFFERHVKELSICFYKLSLLFDNTKQFLHNEISNLEYLSKEALEMFGLESQKDYCLIQAINQKVQKENVPAIFANIYEIEILMLQNFEGNNFYADCIHFAEKTAECLKNLSSVLTRK